MIQKNIQFDSFWYQFQNIIKNYRLILYFGWFDKSDYMTWQNFKMYTKKQSDTILNSDQYISSSYSMRHLKWEDKKEN